MSTRVSLAIQQISNQVSSIKRVILCSLIVVVTINMLGCGFKLRGSQALPSNIKDVYLLAEFKFTPIQRALDERLPVYQLNSNIIELKDLPQLNDAESVIIRLQPEQLDRRLLSVFSTGQVAEYELMYSVDYEVIFGQSEAISATMVVAREYQDDPDAVLAKSRELTLVLDEMRLESADRIIRLLSSQYTQSQLTSRSN